jgi:hypothetical protein
MRASVGQSRAQRRTSRPERKELSTAKKRKALYRSLQLPDRTSDLDLVLVGPGGAWCVQVKAYRTPLRYHAGRWETRLGQSWRPCDPALNPEKAVTSQALRLHDFLAREGVECFVERAITFAESVPPSDVAGSPIPVWLPPTMRRQTVRLATRHPLGDDERVAINAILSRRAAAQRAVEQDRQQRGRR